MNVLKGISDLEGFAVRHIVYFNAQEIENGWWVFIHTTEKVHQVRAENEAHAREMIGRIEEAINRVRF